MSPVSYRSFLDDPLRGVRLLRRWSRVSVLGLVIGLVVLYGLTFRLSWVQALLIVLTTVPAAAVILEIALRLCRSGGWKHGLPGEDCRGDGLAKGLPGGL